jgi:HSP20 family molecular chaperone IbpA
VSYPPPQPYSTTFFDESFPEHHHLFEGTRHKIGAALQTRHDQYIHTPRVDVRETAKRIYIDIELP